MNKIDLNIYGSHMPFTWTRDYLYKLLTTGKNKIIKAPNLRNAFRLIDRSDFFPSDLKDRAYEDADIEIDYGCIVQKPTTIAYILQLLDLKFKGKYLDIGTGSGYTAALMATAAGEESFVYSIERNKFLYEIARTNISKYPIVKNLKILLKDGSFGLKDVAPFNGIHVSASYDRIPDELINQLKIGGRLIAPTVENDLRVIERVSVNEFKETIRKGYFFDRIQMGVE